MGNKGISIAPPVLKNKIMKSDKVHGKNFRMDGNRPYLHFFKRV